jgi:hypothetical protein
MVSRLTIRSFDAAQGKWEGVGFCGDVDGLIASKLAPTGSGAETQIFSIPQLLVGASLLAMTD